VYATKLAGGGTTWKVEVPRKGGGAHHYITMVPSLPDAVRARCVAYALEHGMEAARKVHDMAPYRDAEELAERSTWTLKLYIETLKTQVSAQSVQPRPPRHPPPTCADPCLRASPLGRTALTHYGARARPFFSLGGASVAPQTAPELKGRLMSAIRVLA
jgi:hypothetical protein